MDPGTALGIVSLAWDVSKDIYTYYSLWKNRDKDVIALRARLLSVIDACRVVEQTLQNKQLHTADLTQAEDAIEECRQATETLKAYLRKVSPEDVLPPGLRAKLKSQGRKLLYPFKKAEIESLSDDVLAARDALHFISNVLGLQLEMRTLDELGELDVKINNRFDDVGAALEELKTSQALSFASLDNELYQMNINIEVGQRRSIAEIKNVKDVFIDRLSRTDSAHEKKMRIHELIDSLHYPEMDSRRRMISEAQTETYQWIFMDPQMLKADFPIYQEVAQQLTTWLRQTIDEAERRMYWIRGKAGSGKSTFMKFLRDSEQTFTLLNEWAGSNRLVIIEHYFWVAGHLQEKSILGFLQHLLHQLMGADPNDNFANIESEFARVHGARIPWTIDRLWRCIAKVLERSTQFVCFFIDGLDEAYPDKDHVDLVHRLKQLVISNGNIKMVVSSRPWLTFENSFRQNVSKVTMESVNRKDIMNYTISTLKGVSDGFCFTDAEINEFIDQKYVAGRGKNVPKLLQLAAEVVANSDGVFLWTSLVLDGICERFEAGESTQSVLMHIDDFPPEVEKYFEQLIYSRIHSTWASQTAIILCLMIADVREIFGILEDVGYDRLEYLWLVIDSSQDNPGSLLNLGFADNIPDISDDASIVQKIYEDTRQFLSACCKDLIHVPVPHSECPKYLSDLYNARFCHRTVWDFLHTDKMLLLLGSHLPVTFRDVLFPNYLRIAGLKIGPTISGHFFGDLAAAFDMKAKPFTKFRVRHESYIAGDGKKLPPKLLVEVENLALKGLAKYQESELLDSLPECMTVSTFLAIHGYRAALNKALELISGASCGYLYQLTSSLSPTPLAIALGYPESIFSRFSPCEPSWDWLTLCKLLEHGADPAHLFDFPGGTVYRNRWPRVFVMDSTGALANLLLQFEHWKRVHEFGCHSAEFGWFLQVTGNSFKFCTQKLRGFFEDSLVDAIRLLIEHGADLHELVPVYEVVQCEEHGKVIFDYANVCLTTREIIERRIPIAQSPDWQALLDEHSTVEKRAQLRAARKLMIERWPICWLNTADRRLLRLNHEDEYDIWSTSYADRLSFEDLRRKGILWKIIDLSEECHAPPGSSHSVSPGISVEDSAAVSDSEDDSSNSRALPPARRFSFGDASGVTRNLGLGSILRTSCDSGRESPLSMSYDSGSCWRPITRRRTLS